MSSGLTPDLVIQLIDTGMTQTEIGREYGVSRQYVSKLAKDGGYRNPIRTMTENLPWDVDQDFMDNAIYKNVRRHGILMATGSLSDADLKQVRSLYKKLIAFNAVVDYDPDYPPVVGFSNTNGFAFLPRTENDEDFVIKVKPETKITNVGDRIWRLPNPLP